jgi:RNA polymerase sigma factor (sigma-70 family)
MDVASDDRSAADSSGLGFDRIAQLLGRWQTTELRAAKNFAECRGLPEAQLEDVYQDTAIALLSRAYASEQHLRNALRHGVRHRALNAHRNARRRGEILTEHAPSLYRTARASEVAPGDAALARQDRLIVREFLSELDPLERRVFVLSAEGLRYRAIATALAIPVNEARRVTRSCERKRARFQLLYESGRLGGYRAVAGGTLGSADGAPQLSEQTRAHVAACPAYGKCEQRNAGR